MATNIPNIAKAPKTVTAQAVTTISSEEACIHVLSGIRLIPGDTLVTANQLAILEKDENYLYLKKNFRMHDLGGFREDVEEGDKKVAELASTKQQAETLGVSADVSTVGEEAPTSTATGDTPLEDMTIPQLKELAESLKVTGVSNANKDAIITAIKLVQA